MSFIQIGFLAALAALAIPIIIHLVFRQRAKRVDLGTLRFLRVVLEHNARRRRVMRWLLLMLRLACVGLLAFLFARPYLLAARSAGEKRTVAVLIDRSASMELAAGWPAGDRSGCGERQATAQLMRRRTRDSRSPGSITACIRSLHRQPTRKNQRRQSSVTHREPSN